MFLKIVFDTGHLVQFGNLRHVYGQVFLLFCKGLIVKRLVGSWYNEKDLLKKGTMFSVFSITGKVPVKKERFVIKDIGLLSSF